MSVWAGRGMYTRIKLVGSRITTNAPVRQISRDGACPRSRRCRHRSHMARSRRCDRCSSSMATRCSHQHNTTRDAGNKWTCLSPSTAKLGSESYTQQRYKHGRTLRILKLLKHSSAQFNINQQSSIPTCVFIELRCAAPSVQKHRPCVFGRKKHCAQTCLRTDIEIVKPDNGEITTTCSIGPSTCV